MKKIVQQHFAVLLILAQLLFLLPMTTIPVWAEDDGRKDSVAEETPILNKTVVGTVKFQSFNFLGDNSTGEDGTDYATTFYYTDDYFATSSVNPNLGSITDAEQTQDWTKLEDVSMAACSMDFAVASYTSAEGDVKGKSSQTWNNTNYNKERHKRYNKCNKSRRHWH